MIDETSPYCFVIMSFSEALDTQNAYTDGIRAAVESLGIPCIRVDETHFQGRITERIVDLIKGAYFVVADLSEEKPNCYYECGYAHAFGKVILPVIRKGHRIHFDLHDLPFIVYETPGELARRLRERIIRVVLTTRGRKSGRDPRKCEFGRCAVDLERGRILTATIIPSDSSRYECDVSLEVRPLPGSPPVEGIVTFYLPDEYEPYYYNTRARKGVAQWPVEAHNAFTVGAVADKRATRLELDLAQVPGGPPRFYAA